METVKLEKVSFKYPGCDGYALSNVSFSVEQGELVLLCGYSGSGKTTLLRLLKKQLSPHGELSGVIEVMGKPSDRISDRESAAKIGYVMQNCENRLVAETVWRELAFGPESLGKERTQIRTAVAETAMFFGLEKLYRKKTSELSGGEKQLLGLAGVTVFRPELLLLDEPTAQLDPIAAQNVLSYILRLNRELGVTVIISEHRTDEIFPYASRVIALENGQIAVNAAPHEAAGSSSFPFGMLPTSAKLYRILDDNGFSSGCPLTAAECRRFLSDNFVTDRCYEHSEKSSDVGKPLIVMRELYFRYRRGDPDILRGLSFKVCKGSVTAILGGNGAGKTTLLKIIAGIEKPYSGKVTIRDSRQNKRFRAALLPQQPRELFLTSTVADDLRSAAQTVGDDNVEKRINEITEYFGIQHLLSQHPYDLSGGEQQKAALAKLMLLSPDILLLDEPTKGMDYAAKQKVTEIIRKLKDRGMTVIIVTHDTQMAAICADRCALLFDGEIVAEDAPQRFFSSLSLCTTPEAQIASGIFENAVTLDQLSLICRKQLAERKKTALQKK